MIVVELHPRHPWLFSRTDPETTHSAAIHVERAIGEEVEEETVLRLGWVGDVLGEVLVVVNGVEGGRVEFGEGRVRVLAVEAFLVAVYHCLPIEIPRVGHRVAVRKGSEVYAGDEGLDPREVC